MNRILLVTTVIAVFATFLIASVSSLGLMLLAAILEGLYYGLFASLGITYVQSFAQGRTAQSTALYWNTLMISGLVAGPVVGLIAQRYNFQSVIYFASSVAMASLLVLLAGFSLIAKSTTME